MPTATPVAPAGRLASKARDAKLTIEAIEEILTSPLSAAKLAKRFGVSRQSVTQVRNGVTYRHVLPDLPRHLDKRSCTRCQFGVLQHVSRKPGDRHYLDAWRCSLGFPDIIEHGPQFARECAVWTEAQ
jgi:hypothetical protein